MHAKFWPWGTPYDPSYDHFCVFVSAVNSPILINFKHMRFINPGRYLIFFLIKFPVEWCQNHVWAPIFDISYDHIYKCDYFGYTDGRADGRADGRTGGRADGRAGGRTVGRAGGRSSGRTVGLRALFKSLLRRWSPPSDPPRPLKTHKFNYF